MLLFSWFTSNSFWASSSCLSRWSWRFWFSIPTIWSHFSLNSFSSSERMGLYLIFFCSWAFFWISCWNFSSFWLYFSWILMKRGFFWTVILTFYNFSKCSYYLSLRSFNLYSTLYFRASLIASISSCRISFCIFRSLRASFSSISASSFRCAYLIRRFLLSILINLRWSWYAASMTCRSLISSFRGRISSLLLFCRTMFEISRSLATGVSRISRWAECAPLLD